MFPATFHLCLGKDLIIMKILKTEQYINEKLTIQPVTKDRLSDYKKPSVDEETIRFIKDNNLIWNPLSKSYDCEGDVIIPEDMVTDGKLKIRFGKVGGNFDCSYNELTTLEGAPKKVGGDFGCYNNKLTTLEGAPSVVGRGFYCSYNNLTSLEGAPNEVSGGFYCNNNKLTALKGAPKKVGGDFDCSGNPNLVLPKDKPSWLKGKLIS